MNQKILSFEQKYDISINEVRLFYEEMMEFINQEADYFILNLEHVSYMNSEALGVIASCALKVKDRNKKFIIGGIQAPIMETFRLVRFDFFIEYYNTYQAALESIQNDNHSQKKK